MSFIVRLFIYDICLLRFYSLQFMSVVSSFKQISL